MCYATIRPFSAGLTLLAILALLGAPSTVGAAEPAFGPVPDPPGLPARNADAMDADDDGWMVSSPLANVGWPKVQWPEVKWKPFGRGGEPGAAPSAGPISSMRSMTSGMARRTRSAWNTTVDRLKFDREPKRAIQRADAEPGFFTRVFGGGQQDPGAQTVPEFLAQERPGIGRR